MNEIEKETNKDDQKNEKSFQKKWIILIIIAVALIFLVFGCSKKNNQSKEEQPATEIRSDQEFLDEESDEELTPEEIITRLEKAKGVGVEQGPISVEIISPEEEIFSPNQARHYRAEIEGLKIGSKCSCDWDFYLNENNEEVLYKEMNDRPCTTMNESFEDDQFYTCGFTSTFIDRVGELRVEAEVEVEKKDEIIEKVTAERKYKVE